MHTRAVYMILNEADMDIKMDFIMRATKLLILSVIKGVHLVSY